jgi:hypothetical protein
MEQKFPRVVDSRTIREPTMRAAAIDRIMKTHGMIVKLTADEERMTREKVISFLAERPGADENALAIEGLRYLRSVRDVGI